MVSALPLSGKAHDLRNRGVVLVRTGRGAGLTEWTEGATGKRSYEEKRARDQSLGAELSIRGALQKSLHRSDAATQQL